VVGDASAHAVYERTAEQALAASFPTPVTDTPAAVVADAAQPTAPVATQASRASATKPTLVRN
jgi:hypothetical protein